jgi:hypothetical protein
MTRINVIPVNELSNQHLLAEYRELPRVIKQDIDATRAEPRYHLGRGHMKWARAHWKFILKRCAEIFTEMLYRGYTPKYNPVELYIYKDKLQEQYPFGDYIVDAHDIEINRERVRSKYLVHPDHYTWTNREKPTWLGGTDESRY